MEEDVGSVTDEEENGHKSAEMWVISMKSRHNRCAEDVRFIF